MKRATRRRNYVLQRMADERYITQARGRRREAEADRHARAADAAAGRSRRSSSRRSASTSSGSTARRRCTRAASSVTTTLDATLQEAANRAIEHGLRALDKRHGYRKPTRNVARRGAHDRRLQGRTLDAADRGRRRRARRSSSRRRRPAPARACGSAATTPTWRARASPGRAGRRRPICSSRATRSKSRSRKLDDGDRRRDGDARADAARRRRARRDRQPHRPDQGDGRRLELQPQQVQPRGAGVPAARIDLQADRLHRGDRSRLHAGVDHRSTQPVSYPTGNGQIYSPQNYDHKFEGPITLRRALEESRNIPAIKMMETLGPKNVLAYAKRFGFERGLPAVSADCARRRRRDAARGDERLHGVPESGRADEAVRGADGQGSRRQPARGEPRRAERRHPRRHGVRDDQPAARRRPARHRAARPRASQNWPLAGKTGTVDDNTDAWFIGFDPDITVGVWIGLDEKKSLGSATRQGARRGAADLDGVHEGLHRQPARQGRRRRSSKRPATSCSWPWTRATARCCHRRDAPGRSPKRSSPAPSRARTHSASRSHEERPSSCSSCPSWSSRRSSPATGWRPSS